MSVRPRQLPRFRDQVLRHLEDPAAPLRAHTGEDMRPGLDAMAHHLQHAELYWVAPDMAALAMSSCSQLAAARWATTDRPAPCGLIFFEGGIGSVDARGVSIPVEACTWGPYQGDLLVWTFMSRRRLNAELKNVGQLGPDDAPPLAPIQGDLLPVTVEPVPMAELEGGALPVMQALAACWRLMQQPTLAERTLQRADKAARRNAARDGLADPEVTIVDLRRQYTPQDADPSEGVEDGRRYRHRWVVSGHWRHYRSERYSEELRREGPWWIPAYVKGPDGAPLLATERVNVWRR